MKTLALPITILLSALAVAAGADRTLAQEAPPRITDRAGRTVTVTSAFERIISLYGAHTENLFALGANTALIGVSRHDHYPPEVRRKPVFSYHDGLERFLAAGPDLVLIRPMIDRGYAPLIAGLEQNGITVVSLQPSAVDDMYAYWRVLGLLCGRQTQAEAQVASFRQAVRDFRELTRDIQPRQRVYFEAIHRRMKTFVPGSMPIFALETAGGVNVASDARRVRNTNIAFYGKERILSRAAEIDVFLAQHGTMNQTTRDDIINAPGFSAIKAVQAGRICIVEETLVARPTRRLLAGIDQIGRCLYPDIFETEGLRILERVGLRRAADHR
ncbi:MAG: ABC transporter substrate-binding protein [Desulfobacterales bacterium]|nr:ABC transporter substrate-binding protein [Desulfobacterales bacterium]